MHFKKLTACALAAILAFTPMSMLQVSADETGEPSLVLYSSFDDGSASDQSGQGNNGTITKDENYGTVEFVEGVNGGKAVRIVNDSAHRKANPAANYIDYGDSLKLGTDDFSVSLWYKTDPEGVSEGDNSNDDHGGNDVSLFGNKDYSGGNNRGLTIGNFSAEVPADVRVNFVAKQGTRVEINKVRVCDDIWHHLAATFDRDGNMSVYVDGSLFETKSISDYKDLSIDVDGQNFVLGADGVHQYGTPGATVDELRMYRSVLSADQVAELYNQDKPNDIEALTTLNVTFDNETAEDSSPSGTDGTIVGDVQFVDGIKGKAVKISNDENHRKGNPAEQYITFGKQPGVTLGTGDFTLAFWHKSEGHGASDSALMGNKDYTSGSNIGLAVGNYHAPNVNTVDDVRMNFSAVKGDRKELKNISANNDEWHYLVTSFDREGYMNVYMDGHKTGSVDMSSQAGKSADAGEFVLGADGYFHYGADGCILDEVRIIKKALSEEECTTLYQSQALPLKISKMEDTVRLASTNEYSQDSISEFNAVLENIKAQAANADEATAAVLCTQLDEAYARLLESAADPLLTFDVLSDIHLKDSTSSPASNFIAGLENIAETHPESEALITLGDNITFGSDNNSRTQFFDLLEMYAGNIPNKMILLGNHDVRKNDSSSSNGFSSNYDVAYKAYMESNKVYRDDPESTKIYFDKWIGGYHFIALNTEDGLKDKIYMSDEQLSWLEQKLGESEDGTPGGADPMKPVFVLAHQALNDTHPCANAYGGFGDQDEQVKNILSKYPQAIFLSGHIHNGFGIATTMDREYGTLIDCPSFNDSLNGVTANGTGYQVDVYADRVHFRAKNYLTSEWLPEYDIFLSAPSLPALTEKGETLTDEGYTPDSWETFAEALTSAQGLMNSANEHMRTEVLEAAINLDTAMNELKVNVDKTVLQALFEQCSTENEADYTPSSWAVFKEALSHAKDVLDNTAAAQAEVDSAVSALEDAFGKLIKRADTSELEALYNECKDIKNDNYTDASWKAFQEALKAVADILNNPDASATDISDALKQLTDAKSALEKQTEKPGKPDDPKDPSLPSNGTDNISSSNDTDDDGNAPKTGDTASAFPVLAMLICISGAAAGISFRKR